ncbi:PAS domain S-box protein [Haloarcula montana]|uniref:PAS domain S-box protein n=1 Tax=Haloarcula montana TaxID=3111776 RepID=UPI002D78F7C7|nr:PAS domain S-box protein [Haloarcula sp. GH36]
MTSGNHGEAASEADCIIINESSIDRDIVNIVQLWTAEQPNIPVVVLGDCGDEEVICDVFGAGASNWVPNGLVDVDPKLVADRLKTISEREHAVTSAQEIYDNVAGVAVLHDPESGEMLHANETLCELLGYDRTELEAMQVGEFTADLSGYDHERITDVVSSATDYDEPIEVEWPLETAEGRVRWTEANLRTVQVGGREVVLTTSVDITKRRRQERKYRQVFDNVNDAISVHDPWGEEIVEVNETMADLTGYNRETLLEMDVSGLSVSGDGFSDQEAYETQRRVAATGETETVEWAIETAAGNRRLLETNLAPATIAGEDRVLALSRDVTERTEYERRLKRERDRRSVLFENNPDPVVRVHFEGDEPVIREVNPAFEEVFDFSSAEVVGSTVAEAVVPESEREEYERLRDKAARGESLEQEAPRQTADGIREFLFRVIHFSADQDPDEPTDAYVWYTDVTEQKRRKREYEQIFDGVNEAIVVQDPETAEPLDVNQTFLDRLNYDTVDEIREVGFAGLSASESGYTRERARELCQRVMETGDPETVEWQQETRTGERRWIEATVDSAVIRGEDRILSMQRDVTERKRRERLIRTLHEATDDFQNAETRQEVCEAAINAATEVLDLWLPTCWLHESDEESNMDLLTPVASGDETEELPPGGGPRDLEPGDLEYTVYKSGERRICDPEDLDGGTPPGDALLFPLGEHGLFGAVERRTERDSDGKSGFDDVTLDAAGILIRHVTFALDRVERAQELRESERRFRLIADHIDEIVYVSTADFSEIFYINDASEDIYRRPVSELTADPTSFVEAAHPDDRADYKDDIERVVTDIEAGDPQDAYEGEYRIERDGETRWVTVTRFPVANEDGTIDRIVGRVQDITERKRREREYKQIFNGVTDSITVHDPETAELVDVNDTFCELLGYDRAEILEMGVSGFSSADQGYTMERTREFVRTVVDAEEPQQTEWAVEASDGDIRWLEVKGTTVELNGEQRYVSLNRDITERRRTERRLSEVLDRIDEAIFITRAEEITSGSQAPDYVSAGYEEIWGRSLGEINEAYEDGFFGTLHTDDADEYRAFVEGIVNDIETGTGADSYSHEYRIMREDGETRWVRSDYYPTAWEDGPTRIVIVSRDVTERKRRERRIASFSDATDDLATADTPAEATRIAVEAAAETLELPAVGAFLYDADDGLLHPELLVGQFPSDVATEPIGPGDGPLWEGFATGTIVTSDGSEDAMSVADSRTELELSAGLAELAAWRALSLGNHGLLFVGTPQGALGTDTVQAAHVLAATLEAALNHLEGQRRLAAQEEQLQTQTERAERLDRIARLTQQVEAAITEASNAAEVEREVCERLAETGPYDLAWIGGVDAGSDRLVSRAMVGGSDRYVESMDLTTTNDTADPHPAIDAWVTDELRVEDSLVGDGPVDDWRRICLSEGYQSLCVVPLTYDGITRGVLTVGSRSPNEFGDRERDVLSQLGTTIANALTAIGRRRALESDETVELEFRGPGDRLPFAQAAVAADCRVRLERTAADKEGPTSLYFSFEEDVPTDAVEIAERRLPGAVDVVTEGSLSTLVEAHARDWFGAPIAEYGGILREAVANPDETTILVEVPRQADVRSFVERFQEVAPSLELTAQRQHQRQDRLPSEISERVRTELTERQLEVVRTALSAGYFEWPREHDGSEVASRLEITQPTFNKHLRLAERKTFELLFGADD